MKPGWRGVSEFRLGWLRGTVNPMRRRCVVILALVCIQASCLFVNEQWTACDMWSSGELDSFLWDESNPHGWLGSQVVLRCEGDDDIRLFSSAIGYAHEACPYGNEGFDIRLSDMEGRVLDPPVLYGDCQEVYR